MTNLKNKQQIKMNYLVNVIFKIKKLKFLFLKFFSFNIIFQK